MIICLKYQKSIQKRATIELNRKPKIPINIKTEIE